MEKVGIYDYVPLNFIDDYRNRSKMAYKNMELRITQAGVCIIILMEFLSHHIVLVN